VGDVMLEQPYHRRAAPNVSISDTPGGVAEIDKDFLKAAACEQKKAV
jgi:hypothetical protein